MMIPLDFCDLPGSMGSLECRVRGTGLHTLYTWSTSGAPGVPFLPANLCCHAELQAGKPQKGTVRPLTQAWVPDTGHKLIPLCSREEEEQKEQPSGFAGDDSWPCSFSGTAGQGWATGPQPLRATAHSHSPCLLLSVSLVPTAPLGLESVCHVGGRSARPGARWRADSGLPMT